MMTNSTATEYPDRIRFNWGFHDGASAAKTNRKNEWEKGEHFDEVYEAGFWSGYEEFKKGEYNDNTLSDEAWAKYNK